MADQVITVWELTATVDTLKHKYSKLVNDIRVHDTSLFKILHNMTIYCTFMYSACTSMVDNIGQKRPRWEVDYMYISFIAYCYYPLVETSYS